jgi:hypothetical protein
VWVWLDRLLRKVEDGRRGLDQDRLRHVSHGLELFQVQCLRLQPRPRLRLHQAPGSFCHNTVQYRIIIIFEPSGSLDNTSRGRLGHGLRLQKVRVYVNDYMEWKCERIGQVQ